MNFVEGRFADAENELTFLLEANVGGSLDQMRRDSVGDTSQSADAARYDDHGARRVRAAGNVGSDIGVRLLFNFSRVAADDLLDEVAAAAKAQFLGHDTESAVRGNEVDVFNAGIAFECRE